MTNGDFWDFHLVSRTNDKYAVRNVADDPFYFYSLPPLIKSDRNASESSARHKILINCYCRRV